MPDRELNSGLVRNVRAIDEEAVEALVARIDDVVARAKEASAGLNELIARQEQSRDVTGQLGEHLRVGLRMIKALQALTGGGAKYSEQLREAASRFEEREKEAERRLRTIEQEADARMRERIDALLATFEERLSRTLEHGEEMIRLIEDAERNTAVMSFRAALQKKPAPRSRPRAAPKKSAAEPESNPKPPARTRSSAPKQSRSSSEAAKPEVEARPVEKPLRPAMTASREPAPEMAEAPAEPPPPPPPPPPAPREPVTDLHPGSPPPAHHAPVTAVGIGAPPAPAGDSDDAESETGQNLGRGVLLGLHDNLVTTLEELHAAVRELTGASMNESEKKQLQHVQSSLMTLSDLVRGITDITEGKSGRSLPLPGADLMEFDVRRAVESCANYIRRRAAERGIEPRCEVNADIPAMLRGNGAAFRQMLLYILHGAIKLATEGELTIRVIPAVATPDSSLSGQHTAIPGLSGVSAALSRQSPISARNLQLSDEEPLTLRFEISFHGGEQIGHLWSHATRANDAAEVLDDSLPAGKGILSLLIARRLIEQLGGRFGIETSGGVGEEPRATFWFTSEWERGGHGGSRRNHNRFAVESVTSNLGEVIDLSLGGAKIITKRKPKKELTLQVSDGELTVSVACEVRRIDRLGWRRYEVGLEFTEVTPRAAEVLRRISIQNRVLRHVFDS